jgi:AcrR family transcriptional regulator
MSVRTAPARPRVLASERTERILEEAQRLFSEFGYAGTRMTDVAAAIGVTKPIVYRYFESKQALFEALVRRSLDAQVANARATIDAHVGPTRPMLERLLTGAMSALGEPGALAPWRIAVGEADRFPDLAAFLRSNFMEPLLESIVALFERAIRSGELRGSDSRLLAQLFCAPVAAHTMLLATYADDKRPDFDAQGLMKAHLDGFWRGWAA